MTEPKSGTGGHEARIGVVESDVRTIRTEMGGIKSDVAILSGDVRSLGGILSRIDTGVQRAQERFDEREVARQPNVVAIISVLITMISILVGGSWLISGALATQNERSQWMQVRFDIERERTQRIEDRMWNARGSGVVAHDGKAEAKP